MKHSCIFGALAGICLLFHACGGSGAQDMPDAEPPPDAPIVCGPDLSVQGPANGDLSGTWAAFTRYHANVQGFSSAQISRALYVYEITQTDGSLALTEDICLIEVDSDDGGIKIRLGPGFIQSQPTQNRTGAVTQNGASYDFALDLHHIARGVTLDDEVNDPLPEDPADPRIGDWDSDGHPGLTLLLDGLLSGQLFEIQRDTSAFAGTQVKADRIEGLATWSAEQIFLGSDPDYLIDLVKPAQPDPDPSKHTFQMSRVPAGSDCAYVIANRCDLFVDEAP